MRLNNFAIRISTIRTIFKIFPRAFGGYSLRIIVLALLGFVAGLLEGVGITALIPLFGFFDGSARQPTNLISAGIDKLFKVLNLSPNLPSVLLLIISLFVIKFVLVVLYGYLAARIRAGYEQGLTNRLLKATILAKWPYLVKQKMGKLETLVKIDARQSGQMLQTITTTLMTCATLLAYLLVAINISQAVTAMALAFGVFIFFLYKPLFSFAHALSQQISKINAALAHHINESLLGIKTLKAFGTEDQIISRGKNLFDSYKKLQLRLTVLGQVTSGFIQPLGIVFISGIVAFTFYKTSYNLGALAALVYLIQRIFQYIQTIQNTAHEASSTLPYVENVVSYLRESTQSQEKKRDALEKVRPFNESLVFNAVSFAYPDRTEAIHSLSFKILKGEIVGLIGPSGAGKTTIFDLLLRLLEPASGEICVDGKNINTLGLRDWRRQISYVPQDVFILNDTIFNNIKFFDESIGEKEVRQAAALAQIEDFVNDLPGKFQSLVGERGNLLSAGQKQRLALARALARQPKILLLDEATSALDTESEQKIQTAIEKLKGEMTILIIAHRLSTVLTADKLLVIEKGRLIEEGVPAELLRNKDTYFHKISNLRN